MFRATALRRLPRPVAGVSRTTRRTFLYPRASAQSSGRPVEHLNIQRLSQQSQDYHRNRRLFLVCGSFAGVFSFLYTAWRLKGELSKNPTKLDSALPPTDALATNDAANRKVILHDEEGREVVPTGNSTVTEFPRTIEVPSYTSPTPQASPDPLALVESETSPPTEYILVGMGLRTVTILSLQVYIVGYYIATSDVAALQEALVKRVNPIATTLVPGERDELRNALLDPVQSEEIWQELLQRGIPARSVLRVVPVRDTDFHHLRDGFVRAIQARSPKTGKGDDDGFGEAMRDFRALFSRGSVAKKRELLLVRDGEGRLSVVYDQGKSKKPDGPGGRQLLGTIDDKRVSHTLWLHYLAGKNVASEPARKNIVEGVMEFVERPIGTVASQVL